MSKKAYFMPEGPEIRTVADKLRPVLVSRIITNSHKDERANTVGFDNLKCPVTIIGVRSHGKKLIIDIDSGHMIIASFGMEGRLQYSPGNHSHIWFDISDCQVNGPLKIMKYVFSLYFDDTRYMGGIDIIPNAGIPLYFQDIGPDLLQLALNEQTWMPQETWLAIYSQPKLMKRMICEVLKDQSLVGGIGNYASCEILYYSAIHPERKIESLSYDDWDRIRINSHKVLRLSYAHGGCTIKSFISPDGQPGRYIPAVYGTKKNKPLDPLGNPIVRSKKGTKQTNHWVPAVQI